MTKLYPLLFASMLGLAACEDAVAVWQPVGAKDGMNQEMGECPQPDMAPKPAASFFHTTSPLVLLSATSEFDSIVAGTMSRFS